MTYKYTFGTGAMGTFKPAPDSKAPSAWPAANIHPELTKLLKESKAASKSPVFIDTIIDKPSTDAVKDTLLKVWSGEIPPSALSSACRSVPPPHAAAPPSHPGKPKTAEELWPEEPKTAQEISAEDAEDHRLLLAVTKENSYMRPDSPLPPAQPTSLWRPTLHYSPDTTKLWLSDDDLDTAPTLSRPSAPSAPDSPGTDDELGSDESWDDIGPYMKPGRR